MLELVDLSPKWGAVYAFFQNKTADAPKDRAYLEVEWITHSIRGHWGINVVRANSGWYMRENQRRGAAFALRGLSPADSARIFGQFLLDPTTLLVEGML